MRQYSEPLALEGLGAGGSKDKQIWQGCRKARIRVPRPPLLRSTTLSRFLSPSRPRSPCLYKEGINPNRTTAEMNKKTNRRELCKVSKNHYFTIWHLTFTAKRGGRRLWTVSSGARDTGYRGGGGRWVTLHIHPALRHGEPRTVNNYENQKQISRSDWVWGKTRVLLRTSSPLALSVCTRQMRLTQRSLQAAVSLAFNEGGNEVLRWDSAWCYTWTTQVTQKRLQPDFLIRPTSPLPRYLMVSKAALLEPENGYVPSSPRVFTASEGAAGTHKELGVHHRGATKHWLFPVLLWSTQPPLQAESNFS